jgi:hypothetical protein
METPMFKCGICGKRSALREKPVMVVLETRSVEYPERIYIIGEREFKDEGGYGEEIARETLAHKQCAEASAPTGI